MRFAARRVADERSVSLQHVICGSRLDGVQGEDRGVDLAVNATPAGRGTTSVAAAG